MRKTFAALAVLAFAAGTAFAAPSAGDILKAYKAASGGSAWDSKAVLRTEADLSGMGLTGSGHSLSDLKEGRSVTEYKLGPATGAEGFDGKTPWQKDMSGTVTEQQGGDALVMAVNDSYRAANKWWLPDFGGAAVASLGEKTDASGSYDVLGITPKGGKAFEAWFDAKTRFLAKTVEQRGSQSVITAYSEYGREGDVVIPHKFVVDTGQGEKYLQTIKLTKVQFLGAQPGSAYAAPKVAVNDFAIAGGAAETTLPIKLINNHIYGETRINGKGPFTFVFDTGGHNILTPPVMKELGLKGEGNLAAGGAGEGVMEAGMVNGINLEVGKAAIKDQLFMVFPLDTLWIAEGFPMPGMVGYETFRRFVTRIDYGARTLTLIDPKKFDPKDAGTPVKFEFNDHIPEVMGTFEGIPAKFDIDTGSRSELTVNKPFAEKNKLHASHPKGVTAVEGWGVGGPSTGFVTRGRDMTIGDVKIGPVVATLTDQDKGAFAGSDYSANVGGGILKRFVVTFDYNNKVMYLLPLKGPVEDIGSYDRAGMWINVEGNGFKVVALTKGGPAQQAGVRTDDIITAVDGKPASDLKLYELRKQLRNDKPGSVVDLKLRRGSSELDLKVTLRDQI
jgi:hypothetical protein